MTPGQRAFEAFLRSLRPVLARERGDAFADEVLGAARAEHARLLPQVPDIGGARNVFQPVMTLNGWLVALHRALGARGGSAEDTVRACQEVFEECAVNKWYAAQGETDLAPYCNFADVTYSRLMGMGVDATRTIGLGCDRCELRFAHGRETRIPPTLEGIVPRGAGPRRAAPGA